MAIVRIVFDYCHNLGEHQNPGLSLHGRDQQYSVHEAELCHMKNIFEVLRQKEAELQQMQKEIEALRMAARLLADETIPGRRKSADVYASGHSGARTAPRANKEVPAIFEASPAISIMQGRVNPWRAPRRAPAP